MIFGPQLLRPGIFRHAFGVGRIASPSGPAFDWNLLRDGMTPKRGSVAFTRASTGTFIDPSTSYLTTAAINAARIESDGLLLEASNTNYALQSCNYVSDPWTTFNILSSAAAIAPTNAAEARRIVPSTANASHAYAQKNLSKNTDTTFCISGFFKPQGYEWVYLASLADSNGVSVGSWFNVSTLALGSTSIVRGTIVSRSITTAPNGYVHIKTCYTHDPGYQFGCGVSFYVCNANGGFGFAGNGTSGVDVFGIECKPTAADSYIPTGAASATRSADVCTLTIPAGVSRILITYGDNTTVTASVTPGGTYVLPASQKKYKSIVAL